MMRATGVFWAVGVIALVGTVNCSSREASPEGDDEAELGTARSALLLPARCYGKMLKPMPLDYEQPVGLAMTLRINRTCLTGAPLVDRKIRVYIRRHDGGLVGPQQLLVDWSDWPGGQYRFEAPWTAGHLLAGGDLVPGRYQIFSYTVNASLYDDWVNGDSYARNMSTRSDNTYVELHDPGTWSSGSWGACSAACGGGTQTRTNTCVDGGANPLDARMCLDAEPASSQTCNPDACGAELYSARGWRGDGKVYKLDLATGTPTVVALDGDENAVLGATGSSLVRFHWSSLELVNPTTLATTSTVTLSPGLGEPGAIVASGADYYATRSGGALYYVTSTGTVTSVGSFGGGDGKALAWDAAGTGLYTCNVDHANLRKLSTSDASTLATVGMTSSFGTVLGCFSLATQPGSGITYALVRYGAKSGDRRLGTVDLTTGVVTDIGLVGTSFRSLAFL
jgi:hypothetical protein